MKLLVKAAVAAAAVLAAAAAGAESIRLGALPAADSIILYAAESEGLFKKQGLDVEVVPFKSAVEVAAAMRADKLGGHFADLMNVVSQNQEGIKQKVVATTTYTNPHQRSFGFVVSPKHAGVIKDLDYVKTHPGVTTTISTGTIIDYLMTRMSETEGIPRQALQAKEVKQIPVRLQLLMSGQIQTGAFPEPLVTLVEQKGGRCIWDDRGLNESLAVVSLKEKHLDPKTVAAFRTALGQAAAMIEADPEKYRAQMIKMGLLPKPAAEKYAMPKFSIYGTGALPPLPSAPDVQRVLDWMKSVGTLKVELKPEDIVYPAQ